MAIGGERSAGSVPRALGFPLFVFGSAAVMALSLAVYAPTLHFGFVNWDDPEYVIHNPLIRSWEPANLAQIATTIVSRNYAPLTIFSYLVDHTLWGDWPGGYHLTNLLLHITNAALVYFLIWQVTRKPGVAWVTAALFAVHPVQIETVAWVSSRKGLLSATFILASLLCWLRPDRTHRHETWGTIFLALALLSKAIAVVVPAIVLTYDWIIRRHPLPEACHRQFIPGLMASALLWITMQAQNTGTGGLRTHLSLATEVILALDAIILWKYVGMLLWPANLCVLYDQPTTDILWPACAAVAGWLIGTACAWTFRRRAPLPVFAAISFVILLLPVLNLFRITTLMNDRYLYLPSIPFFAVCASTVGWLLSEFGVGGQGSGIGATIPRFSTPGWLARWRHGMAVALAMLSVGWYTVCTREHLPVWRDGVALWKHAAQHQPQLAVVQIQLADAFFRRGEKPQAAEILKQLLDSGRGDEIDRARAEYLLAECEKSHRTVSGIGTMPLAE